MQSSTQLPNSMHILTQKHEQPTLFGKLREGNELVPYGKQRQYGEKGRAKEKEAENIRRNESAHSSSR
jgi:hypothetical protein